MNKNRIANFLGFLTTATITGVGLSMTSNQFVGGAIIGLGIELGSGFIESVCSKLKKNWTKENYGLLNHDIQKSLQRSIVAALNDMQTECLTMPFAPDEREPIKNFYDSLIKESKEDFFHKYLEDKNDNILKDLINKNSSTFEKDITDGIYNEELLSTFSLSFKHYFKETLVKKLRFWFTEDLKGEGDENKRARVAYEKILLESIENTLQEQCNKITSLQTQVGLIFENSIRAINEGKTIQETLQKLFPQFPSFSLVTIPQEESNNADKFYDGFPPQLEDLKANFDFPRNLYLKDSGVKSRINELTSSDAHFVKFILIKGVGGSGKSTLLKRISFDQTIIGKNVFTLNKDWFEDKQINKLQTQIKRLAESYPDCVIVLDDIADCILREEINFPELINSLSSKRILFVLADQPDRWNRVTPKVRELNTAGQLLSFDLHQLDEIECEDLADKMIELESEEKLSIRHLELTKEERVKLCKENSKRHFVVAMLQIRYGKRFSDIIIEEFEKIPSEKGKEAYLMVCFCNHLGLSIPESIVISALHLTSSLSINEFHSYTEGIVIFSKYGLSSRHPIIAREIIRNFVKTKIEFHFNLKQIFSSLGENKIEVSDFLDSFLSKENIHKTLAKILEKDIVLIEDIIQIIESKKHLLEKDLLIKLMSFYGMTERLIGNDEKALEIFKQIISEIDKGYSFAYRQIAWIEHDNQNYDEAANYAIQSYQYSNENPEHIIQIAKLLALNTVKNFREAKKYYVAALEKSNKDKYYQEELEKYTDAENALNYFSQLYDDDFIPDDIIKALRPGLNFFRIYFHTNSKEFKNKLINVLHGMEGDTKGSIEDLDAVVEGFNIKKDKLVSSKYYGNLARIMYLEWYKNEKIIDPTKILEVFQTSLTLNSNDPFTHCWLGTFYKEVLKDFVTAEAEYKKAIALSKNSKYEHDKDHPLFSNNLALLIMDEVVADKLPKEKLFEAKSLLDFSVKVNTEKQSSFYWAEHNLSKCLDLIDRYKLTS